MTPPPSRDDRTLRGRRILLAEDDEINREMVAEILSSLGGAVDVAQDGAEAIRAHAARRYDLILMDCGMPRIDGLAATAAIRAQERSEAARRGHTPILALTAHALEGDREACLEAGMDDYISKPIDLERFVDVVTTWCGGTAHGTA